MGSKSDFGAATEHFGMNFTTANERTGKTAVMPYADLYKSYHQIVLKYIHKKISNLQDAEDLTHEVFISCYRNYDRYDPAKSSQKTWLFVIVCSRLKNYYRDHKTNDSLDDYIDLLEDDKSDIDRSIIMEQYRSELAKALMKLSLVSRSVVVFKYFRHMPVNEIAAELGISQGNARVILSRALKTLSGLIPESIHDGIDSSSGR